MAGKLTWMQLNTAKILKRTSWSLSIQRAVATVQIRRPNMRMKKRRK